LMGVVGDFPSEGFFGMGLAQLRILISGEKNYREIVLTLFGRTQIRTVNESTSG
jgi:hypothetical protein